jgi:ABC-2 type transport system permease protein
VTLLKKILLVLKNEIVSVVFRRSFILTLVLVPIVPFIILMVLSAIEKRQPGAAGTSIQELINPASKPVVEGYVDPGGLIRSLPPEVQGRLLDFDSEAAARQSMAAGEIKGYYLLPADYIASGRIVYVRPEYNPMAGMIQSGDFEKTLEYNLLGEDAGLANRLDNPLNLEVTYLSGQKQRDPQNMLTFFVPYGISLLFYIVIFGAASLMLNSITSEKQSRVLEILMTSITPTQMLVGKIVALGLVGLAQTIIWDAAGIGLLRLGGQEFHLPDVFQLSFSLVIWGAIYFILGYAVFAGLMAGVGALVPNLREASQVTLVIALPMFIPLILISNLSNQPNSAISIALGLFPLTAPVTMMARLASSTVPAWQLALSVGLLALTAVMIIRSVAGMFRAQHLLAGQTFNLKLFARALLGKI